MPIIPNQPEHSQARDNRVDAAMKLVRLNVGILRRKLQCVELK
jgi:hypothetical protein